MPHATPPTPLPSAATKATVPPPAAPTPARPAVVRWTRAEIVSRIAGLAALALGHPAFDGSTPPRDDLADSAREELHQAWAAGAMTRREVEFWFALLLHSMPPAWHRNPGFTMRAEALRTALGYPEQSYRRLEALLRSTTDAALQRRLLLQLLELCQTTQDVARGWPLFARFQTEHLATAKPQQVVDFHRHWTAMLTQVGTLDAAEEKLQQATQALARLREPDAAQRLLRGRELDLWLAAERFDRAEAMLAAAEPGAFQPGRAELAQALIDLRSDRREPAKASLARLATKGSLAERAAAELTLLHVLDGDLAAATRTSAPLRQKPLAKLTTTELVAVARVSLLAVAQRRPPEPTLAELDLALQAEYEKTLRRWAAVPPTASGVPFLFLAGRRDLLATLVALRLERHGEAAGASQALQLWLTAEAMGSMARTLGLPTPDLATVRQRLLPAKGMLLAFLPAPTQSFVLGLTATECFAIPLRGDAGLRARVRELRRLTGDQPTPDAAQALAAAARPVVDWCLPPAVRARLDAHHHIAVVGRDLTGLIPFEALPYAADGSELGTAKAIGSVPSMVLMCHYAARQPQTREHSVAVLAATAIDPRDGAAFGIEPIPPDPAGFAAWAADGTGRGMVLAPATAADLLQGAGAKAQTTVVLGHGMADLTSTRAAGVLLARAKPTARGTVLADDIQTAADLVLLLVCNAASGPPRRGEDGGHHLGGALLQHGASAVVLAEHDLELQATLHWAGQFLRAFQGGADAAEAARQARAAVRARPEWRHPWFHASLRVDGLGTLTAAQCGPLPQQPR